MLLLLNAEKFTYQLVSHTAGVGFLSSGTCELWKWWTMPKDIKINIISQFIFSSQFFLHYLCLTFASFGQTEKKRYTSNLVWHVEAMC